MMLVYFFFIFYTFCFRLSTAPLATQSSRSQVVATLRTRYAPRRRRVYTADALSATGQLPSLRCCRLNPIIYVKGDRV